MQGKLYAIIFHFGYRDEEYFNICYQEQLYGIAATMEEAQKIANEGKSDACFDEQTYDDELHGRVEIRSYIGTDWKTEMEIPCEPRSEEEQEACWENGSPEYYLEGKGNNIYA